MSFGRDTDIGRPITLDLSTHTATVDAHVSGAVIGKLLVATGATSAVWKNEGVILVAPDLSGVVTAASLLTMPAFKLGGPLTLNGKVFDAEAGNLQVNTTGTIGLIIASSRNPASGQGAGIEIRNTGTASDGSYIEQSFQLNDSVALTEFGRILLTATNTADGAEQSTFRWFLQNSGSNLAMTLIGAGELSLDIGVDVDETYKVAGTQVVSAQGAAVANPTDAASTQARLIDLLGRLRTHGMIAT